MHFVILLGYKKVLQYSIIYRIKFNHFEANDKCLYIVIEMNFFKNLDSFSQDVLPFVSIYRIVPDIRSIIVNLARYHTTNRLAAHANENGPVTGGCPISSMATVNIYIGN